MPRQVRRCSSASARAILALFTVACSSEPAPVAPSVTLVSIDRETYLAAPRVRFIEGDTICGARPACPNEEPLRVAVSRDGEVALLTERSSVFVVSAQRSLRQIVFDNNPIGNLQSEAAIEATSNGGWRLLIPGSARFISVDSVGRLDNTTLIPLDADFFGAAAFEGSLVKMHLPAAATAGDSVEAEFVGVTPREGFRGPWARLRTASVRSTKSDLIPLPPFFRTRPLWTPVAPDTVLYADRSAYRVAWVGRAGPWRELRVDAPLREVTPEELNAESARFLAQMPKSPRFREALSQDVERRRNGAPRNHPAVSSLLIAGDRRMLVASGVDPESGIVRWDLFDGDGSILGHFEMADYERVLNFEGRRLILGSRGAADRSVVRWVSLEM